MICGMARLGDRGLRDRPRRSRGRCSTCSPAGPLPTTAPWTRTLTLWMNNVTDQTYAYNFGNPFSGTHFGAGPATRRVAPRSGSVSGAERRVRAGNARFTAPIASPAAASVYSGGIRRDESRALRR